MGEAVWLRRRERGERDWRDRGPRTVFAGTPGGRPRVTPKNEWWLCAHAETSWHDGAIPVRNGLRSTRAPIVVINRRLHSSSAHPRPRDTTDNSARVRRDSAAGACLVTGRSEYRAAKIVRAVRSSVASNEDAVRFGESGGRRRHEPVGPRQRLRRPRRRQSRTVLGCRAGRHPPDETLRICWEIRPKPSRISSFCAKVPRRRLRYR
jgi:hypothetical protein